MTIFQLSASTIMGTQARKTDCGASGAAWSSAPLLERPDVGTRLVCTCTEWPKGSIAAHRLQANEAVQ